MLYFIDGLIFSVIVILFINIYCVLDLGFTALHELSHLILPAIPTIISIYRGEYGASEVRQLSKRQQQDSNLVSSNAKDLITKCCLV